jgi:hypothetical protein
LGLSAYLSGYCGATAQNDGPAARFYEWIRAAGTALSPPSATPVTLRMAIADVRQETIELSAHDPAMANTPAASGAAFDGQKGVSTECSIQYFGRGF